MSNYEGWPFKQLFFDATMKGGTIVYFAIDPEFDKPEPWGFRLQYGRSVNDTFEYVDEDYPAYNVCFLIDPLQRLWNRDIELYYRVELEAYNDTYYSVPQRPTQYWNKLDWAYTRRIRRDKVWEWMKMGIGVRGALLKRKIWGDKCPQCTDERMGTVMNASCETCYGTGIVGGYFDPIEYWIGDETGSVRQSKRTNMGNKQDVKIQAVGLGCPWIGQYDYWVNYSSDERWVIDSRKPIPKLRNVPALFHMNMSLVHHPNVIYKFEVTTP